MESTTFCVGGMIFSEKFGLCFGCIGTNMNKPRSSWKCILGGACLFTPYPPGHEGNPIGR